MNLYRNFGNLMEAWVNEGSHCFDSEWFGNNAGESPLPSSGTETNLCSELMNSGVETSSCDTSFPAKSCFVSADNAKIDTFIPEREGGGLTSDSTAQLPHLSSSSASSPLLCSSRAEEETLQNTHAKCPKDKPGPPTVEEVLRRRPRASSLPKQRALNIVRGQRSQSLGLRKTISPSVPIREMPEAKSMSCDTERSEDLDGEEKKELSPGFNYLEQVCQMLEDIALQQMLDRALQMKKHGRWEHRAMQPSQAPHTCQSDCTADEGPSSCQNLESTGNAEHNGGEPQHGKDNAYRYFRKRSSSDPTVATQHLIKLNADYRGQHLIADDLLEKAEEDHEQEEPKKEDMNKTNENWKLKIRSFKRQEPAKE